MVNANSAEQLISGASDFRCVHPPIVVRADPVTVDARWSLCDVEVGQLSAEGFVLGDRQGDEECGEALALSLGKGTADEGGSFSGFLEMKAAQVSGDQLTAITLPEAFATAGIF